MLNDVKTTHTVASHEAESSPVEIVRNFWQGGSDLVSLEYNAKKSNNYCPALKILGNPPGWPRTLRFNEIMSDMYRYVADAMERRNRGGEGGKSS